MLVHQAQLPAIKTETSPVPSTLAQGAPPTGNGQESNAKRPQSSQAVPVPGADKSSATQRMTRAAARAAAAEDSKVPAAQEPTGEEAAAAAPASRQPEESRAWPTHRGSGRMPEDDAAVLFPVSAQTCKRSVLHGLVQTCMIEDCMGHDAW